MNETIPSLFARQAGIRADQPLFLTKRRGICESISWRQVQADAFALSTFFLHQQVEIADRVLIISESRPEWGIADLAILSIGAWTVPIYPSLTERDLSVACEDCRPVICVASTLEQWKKLLTVSPSAPSIRAVLLMESPQERHPLLIGWLEALAKGRELSARFQDAYTSRRNQIKPDDTATIIYTSGTTGEPKGVMLSHRNFLSNAQACLGVIPIRATDRYLSFLPLSHVFERMAGWYLLLLAGASVAYAKDMDSIAQDMLEVRPTIMLGVPRFFEKLHARIQERVRQASQAQRALFYWAERVAQTVVARRAKGRRPGSWLRLQLEIANSLVFRMLRERLGGRLRFFVSGSAPLSKDIAEFFYGLGITILEGYGLTETSPVIAVNRLAAPRFGSVGQLLPGVDVTTAPDGEILTRGPHVMKGYYNKPEATAAAIIDGWFHTGDIGYMDGDGYLHITDRKRDLIKTAGGKFVSPQKLETLFISDPYISQAFLYGDRRPYCVALLVPNAERLRSYAQEQRIPGQAVSELIRDERIRSFYWSRVQVKQEGLAPFEQVKKIALLDQEFSQTSGELTPTLKARRATIAQRYQPLLDSLYQSAVS